MTSVRGVWRTQVCCVLGGRHLWEVAVHDQVEAEDLAVELQRLDRVLDAQHRLLHDVRLGHRVRFVLIVFHYLVDRGAHGRRRSSKGRGGAAAGVPTRSGVKGKGRRGGEAAKAEQKLVHYHWAGGGRAAAEPG
jgi:hypothetical protein